MPFIHQKEELQADISLSETKPIVPILPMNLKTYRRSPNSSTISNCFKTATAGQKATTRLVALNGWQHCEDLSEADLRPYGLGIIYDRLDGYDAENSPL